MFDMVEVDLAFVLMQSMPRNRNLSFDSFLEEDLKLNGERGRLRLRGLKLGYL
jgi:hypothetical protein